MNNITGCILARNEQSLLPGCIESLLNFTDEIILVDNGSADQTVNIGKKYGCKIINSPETIVDEGRNKYLDAAKSDWVFVLDADERLTIDSGKALKEAIQHVSRNILAFRMPKYEYIGEGRYVETSTVRFFRVHPSIRYNAFKMHASASASIEGLHGKEFDLYEPIHHFDILCNRRIGEKRSKYLKILLSELSGLVNHPKLWWQYIHIATEYTAIGEYDTAIEYLFESIRISQEAFYFATLYLSQIYLYINKIDEAQDKALSLLKKNNKFVDRALSILAKIEYTKNDLHEAKKILIKSIDLFPEKIYLHLNLYSLSDNDNPYDAINYLESAIKKNPYLDNPFIYKQGACPNTFNFQSLFLPTYKSIFSILENAYKKINNMEKYLFWKSRQEYVASHIIDFSTPDLSI